MNLRWKIERNIYDYFNADTDPVLQFHNGLDWINIPRIVIENDRRVYKDESCKKISVSEVTQDSVYKVQKFPDTTSHMVVQASQMDMYDMWKSVSF